MHTNIPIVDVLLPTGHEDHVRIPHVNLSITGYHPDTLRSLVGTGSPSARAPEVSTIPQLDGPRSLPRLEPERRQMEEISNPIGLSSSQRGTNTQRISGTRRREYPESDSSNDSYGRS